MPWNLSPLTEPDGGAQGFADVKLNLNPEGWIDGVTKEKDWRVSPSYGCQHALQCLRTRARALLQALQLVRPKPINPRTIILEA